MHDVIVIGAGPAGAAVALYLKSFNPRMDVLLVERLIGSKYQGYHRMCGQGVSRRAFRSLQPIAPDGVVNLIEKAEEVWPGDITIRTRAKGYIMDRPTFLGGLIREFREAGGVMINASVNDVREVEGGYEVSTSEGDRTTRYVVGADGAHSLVRRQLFEEEPLERIPVKQYILPERSPDVMRFCYGSRYRGGYGWRFPLGRRTSIGFPKNTAQPPDGAVEEHGRHIPVGPLNTIVQGNAILVGDAASQVNPVTFGGIRVSLVAARQAAKALAKGKPQAYQRWWSRCPENDPLFMVVYLRLKDMDDDRLTAMVEPFRNGYGVLPYLRAWFRRPEDRGIYKAFMRAQRYGW